MKMIGVALGLTAAAIWGGMYVVSDVVLQTVPPFTLLTLRLLLGLASLVLLAALISRHSNSPRLPFSLSPFLLFIGFIGYGLSLGFQLWGTALSTAANGALITSAAPAFVALFAYFLLKERITLPRILAVTLATFGVAIVVFDPGAVQFNADTRWGNLGLFGAAVTWGLYSVLVKRAAAQGIPTLTITVMAPLGGLIVAVPLMLWELMWERIA